MDHLKNHKAMKHSGEQTPEVFSFETGDLIMHETNLKTVKSVEIEEECAKFVEKYLTVTQGEDTKATNQPTYLCPVSDCVFTCPTLQDGEGEQHLQLCHGDRNYMGQKFIRL